MIHYTVISKFKDGLRFCRCRSPFLHLTHLLTLQPHFIGQYLADEYHYSARYGVSALVCVCVRADSNDVIQLVEVFQGNKYDLDANAKLAIQISTRYGISM